MVAGAAEPTDFGGAGTGVVSRIVGGAGAGDGAHKKKQLQVRMFSVIIFAFIVLYYSFFLKIYFNLLLLTVNCEKFFAHSL